MSFFKYKNKNIYYKVTGEGKPVVFLHGNTASSKMFEYILPLYQDDFKVILMDFLGCGKSERVEKFKDNLWLYQSEQLIALIDYFNTGKVSLVGTSGGAYGALNCAMQIPFKIDKIVCDSFDGLKLRPSFSKDLLLERNFAKQDEMARGFYQWCNGDDWEKVVDLDTQCLLKMADENIDLFCKPISEIKNPLLLIGSKEDSMIGSNFIDEYKFIKSQVRDCKVAIVSEGEHPSICTNAKEVSRVIKEFL